MKKRIPFVALMLLMATAAPTFAVNVVFAGNAANGADPFGHTWQFQNNSMGGNGSWGMPGLFAGSHTAAFPDFARDFHITFELPQGTVIDSVTPSDPGGDSTIFRETGQLTWNRVFTGANSVSFFAPPGEQLDMGEDFFINVIFSAPLPTDGVAFVAEWTMDGGIGVPEPASVSLALMGAAGLLMRRRRTA